MTVNTQTVKKLLITRHDKIGDFVLSLPLCKAIKASHPDIWLAVLVSRVNVEFAKALDFIDEVILYEPRFQATLGRVKRGRFDASISCFIDTRLGILLWLSGIPRRIGPATKMAQLFFNDRVVQHRSRVEKTEWQYNMDLGLALFAAGELKFSAPLINFPNLVRGRRVVFHPGFGGSSDGNLRLADYVALARRAAHIPGVEVVFTFGPDDAEAHRQVAASIDFPATLIHSSMTLMEFCQFLAQSALFVSTSTGPMHLAGAVNTPTLSFFGESLFASAARWATISHPDRQRHHMIGRDYSPSLVQQIEHEMLELLSATLDPAGARS